jgi:hypothetical protein
MSIDCAGRHQCEPDFYPALESDRWTCDECGKVYRPFLIAESPNIPDAVRKYLKHDQLGWTTRPELGLS